MFPKTKKSWVTLFAVMALASFCITPDVSFARPALYSPGETIQPDGTKIVISHRGDEWLNWWSDPNGRAIVRCFDGWWRYATGWDKGKLTPSAFIVGKTETVDLASIPERLVPPKDMISSAMEKRISFMPRESKKGKSEKNASLDRNTLLINLSYQNQPDFPHPKLTSEQVNQMWYDTSVKSVTSYYDEISFNGAEIIPVRESQGTANDGIVDIVLPGSHPNPGNSFDDEAMAKYMNGIVIPAINACGAYVDFSSYDANGDGFLAPEELAIVLLVNGWDYNDPRNTTDSVYGHASWGDTPYMTIDGVGIGSYTVFGTWWTERGGADHISTIGVQVHEFGHLAYHMLDTYDYDYDSNGTGDWDMYAAGMYGRASLAEYPGATPVHPLARNKMLAGFISPRIISSPVSGVSIEGRAEDGVVEIPSSYNGEYFLLEVRWAEGFDEGLFPILHSLNTGGLLITHIDDNVKDRGNDDQNHYWVGVMEAHGGVQRLHLTDTTGGDNGVLEDLFYSGNNTSFNAATDPNSDIFAGTEESTHISEVSIENVSNAADTMTFDVVSSNPGPSATPTPTATVAPSLTPTPTGGSSSSGGGCSAGSSAMFLILAAPLLYGAAMKKRI